MGYLWIVHSPWSTMKLFGICFSCIVLPGEHFLFPVLEENYGDREKLDRKGLSWKTIYSSRGLRPTSYRGSFGKVWSSISVTHSLHIFEFPGQNCVCMKRAWQGAGREAIVTLHMARQRNSSGYVCQHENKEFFTAQLVQVRSGAPISIVRASGRCQSGLSQEGLLYLLNHKAQVDEHLLFCFGGHILSAWGPDVMLEIQPRLAPCKVNAFPTVPYLWHWHQHS